jgi:DNA replication protein DnaC
MNNYTKLINGLETLELSSIRGNIDTYITMINNGEKGVVDALYELVRNEIEYKKLRTINACVKVANFPFKKTLDDFDFSFQPSINKQEFLDLTTLRFINNWC